LGRARARDLPLFAAAGLLSGVGSMVDAAYRSCRQRWRRRFPIPRWFGPLILGTPCGATCDLRRAVGATIVVASGLYISTEDVRRTAKRP